MMLKLGCCDFDKSNTHSVGITTVKLGYLSKTPEKSNFSYLFFTARMVPIGKHIFSFGVISYVLSFVWYLINNKHAEDNIII